MFSCHIRPQYQLSDRASWIICLAILFFSCSVNFPKLLEYQTEVDHLTNMLTMTFSVFTPHLSRF